MIMLQKKIWYFTKCLYDLTLFFNKISWLKLFPVISPCLLNNSDF